MSLLLLLACTTTSVTTDVPTCDLPPPVATPAEAEVGERVRLVASSLTDTWDTVVQVGAATADIIRIGRDDCEDCDGCRADAGCAACGACDACADACASCVETVRITVPDVAPGTWPVRVINRHGQSEAGALTVVDGDDTGGDTGAR